MLIKLSTGRFIRGTMGLKFKNKKMIKKTIDELDVIDELAKEIGYLRTIVKEQSEDVDKMKKEIRDLKFRC